MGITGNYGAREEVGYQFRARALDYGGATSGRGYSSRNGNGGEAVSYHEPLVRGEVIQREGGSGYIGRGVSGGDIGGKMYQPPLIGFHLGDYASGVMPPNVLEGAPRSTAFV